PRPPSPSPPSFPTRRSSDLPAATGESEEVEALRARLEPLLPRAVEDLKDLVRIPSIAFAGYDTEPVRRSAEAVAAQQLGDRPAPDRKSTRLNSSHVSISYAV